jgi:hypothetical protein
VKTTALAILTALATAATVHAQQSPDYGALAPFFSPSGPECVSVATIEKVAVKTALRPRDFLTENGTHAVKTTRPMTRRFLGEASLSFAEIDRAAVWVVDAVANSNRDT